MGGGGGEDLSDFSRSLVELVADEERLEGKIAGGPSKSSYVALDSGGRDRAVYADVKTVSASFLRRTEETSGFDTNFFKCMRLFSLLES